MRSNSPKVSLVIPTHNRSQLLEKVLISLVQQNIPAEYFEVIVVADRCTDNTAEVVMAFKEVLDISFIEPTLSGPASARNAGAQQARGDHLLFIDDDIETQPQFLAAHIRAHQGKQRTVVIGYLPPLLKNQKGYFRVELLGWWEMTFQKIRQPGHRFSYTDLVSGNFSVPAQLFKEVGGFDTRYWCHEDYELGVKLLQAGATFTHSMDAAGYHHEQTGIDLTFKRKFDEGVADVQLGNQYPFLKPTLLMAKLEKYSLLPSHFLKFLALHWPKTGDFVANLFRKRLDFIERIRWYGLWRRILYGLMGYWYWRGVATELPSLAKVKEFLSKQTTQSETGKEWHINLAEGISKAESILDEYQPDCVFLSFNDTELGWIPYQPGREPLRGRHLRPFLLHRLSPELIKALAEEPDFPYPSISTELVSQCEELLKLKRHVQEYIE